MDAPSEQIVFFIRHSESRWNRAQADNDILSLIWENDHGLTSDGIHLAAALRDRICAARGAHGAAVPAGRPARLRMANEETEAADLRDPWTPASKAEVDWVQHFLEPDALFCSPFTRALETACVALKDVIGTRQIVVLREAREQKNFGSADSTGVACGSAIRERVEADIREIMGPMSIPEQTEALLQEFRSIEIDTSGVEDEWWGPVTGDWEEQLEERVEAFMSRLRETRGKASGGGGAAIVVGHSYFLRTVFDTFLTSCPAVSPDSWKFRSLRQKVLPYCGVVGTRIRWDESGRASIVEAVPLFGTQLAVADDKNGGASRMGGCVCGRGEVANPCAIS